MKTITQIILVIIFTGILFSCKDDEMEYYEDEINEYFQETEGVIYPKSLLNPSTRSLLNINDWEQWTRINFASGGSTTPPWDQNSIAGGSLPDDVRFDIKKEEGWELIAHTVNEAFVSAGVNYLLFHNKYSGILKVFYFIEDHVSVLQNTAMWKVQISTPQNLLAFTSEFADPINSTLKRQIVYCSNITTSEGKGFTKGWNCFQFEVSYDPNFVSGNLMIEPYNMTTSKIEQTGSFESRTEGLLFAVPGSSVNPADTAVSSISKAAGNAAKDWVKKEVEAGKFASTLVSNAASAAASIASGGVSSIVKLGLNKVFSSFSSSSTPTTQKIVLNTTGKVKMEGKITTVGTGGYMGVTINISKSRVGSLGVWNLSQEPTIYLLPVARRVRNTQPPSVLQYQLVKYANNTYNIQVNPNVGGGLTSESFVVRLDPYQIPGGYNWGTFTSLWGVEAPTRRTLYEDVYYQDFEVPFYVTLTKPGVYPNDPPDEIFVPYAKQANGDPFMIKPGHVIRLTTTIKKGDMTVVNTKTFVPKHEWRDFEAYKNLPY